MIKLLFIHQILSNASQTRPLEEYIQNALPKNFAVSSLALTLKGHESEDPSSLISIKTSQPWVQQILEQVSNNTYIIAFGSSSLVSLKAILEFPNLKGLHLINPNFNISWQQKWIMGILNMEKNKFLKLGKQLKEAKEHHYFMYNRFPQHFLYLFASLKKKVASNLHKISVPVYLHLSKKNDLFSIKSNIKYYQRLKPKKTFLYPTRLHNPIPMFTRELGDNIISTFPH